MKAISIFLISLLFITIRIEAQNLIPNPGFEPEDTSSIYCGIYLPADFNSSVDSWLTPTDGTPDLFSTHIDQSCWNFQPNSTYPGPIGLKGPQLPHAGRVMAGMFCYTIPGFNQREYIQSPLISPLVPGNLYYVEYYVSLADNTEKYTNSVGAFFSVIPPTSLNDQPLPCIPQIVSPNIVSDTAAWTKISGTFVASAAFEYITIGNFNDDASTTTGNNPGSSGQPGCYGAYYFIDDIAVLDLTAGIDYPTQNNSISIYPNPANEKLTISTGIPGEQVFVIYDIASRELKNISFNNQCTIDIHDLTTGLYLYALRNKYSVISYGKFLKQ